ncbi:MAG TPA: hypothetical protein VKZ63_08615 [Kofleriaceae bacterium]|nr:hypothetical protein [Kofleriaceae bacterium]
MRAPLLLAPLCLSLACSADSPVEDSGGGERADAAPAADAGGGSTPDAGGGDDGPVDAGVGEHGIEAYCMPDDTPGLRIAVTELFQSGTCFPQDGHENVILFLAEDAPTAGQTVPLGVGGSHAYVCPADTGQNCVRHEVGEVVFDTFEDGVGASGMFSFDGGAVKGLFDAHWCEGGFGC